jgi:hypothetical protein
VTGLLPLRGRQLPPLSELLTTRAKGYGARGGIPIALSIAPALINVKDLHLHKVDVVTRQVLERVPRRVAEEDLKAWKDAVSSLRPPFALDGGPIPGA